MTKSKTLWSNAVVLIIIIFINGVESLFDVKIPEEWHESILGFLLDPENQLIILAIWNGILRFFTNKPIKEKVKFLE